MKEVHFALRCDDRRVFMQSKRAFLHAALPDCVFENNTANTEAWT